MQNGLKQGRGTLALSNGDPYEGSFVKNQMNGFGEHILGKPTKGILKTGKNMVSGLTFKKLSEGQFAKEKESCLFKTERFIKDYLW